MKKQILLAALGALLIFPAYGQSGKVDSEYRKFYFSLNGGLLPSFGTSNTTVFEFFTLPFSKNILVPGFDGAYFFTKNYGVGIKYRFNRGHNDNTAMFEYMGQIYTETKFNETLHYAGPAFFAKWQLGESRWTILTNLGVGYIHDKLFKMLQAVGYIDEMTQYVYSTLAGSTDLMGTSIGFSASAGIHYRILPFIGVGIDANGLFSSISRMKYKNIFNGKYETSDISRKISRAGLSASIDFSF